MMASLADFHFSHRVWFFMKTEVYKARNVIESSQVLKGLKNVAMHDENNEVLFLCNSRDIILLLIDLEMINLYPSIRQVLFNDIIYREEVLRAHMANRINLADEVDAEEQMYRIVRTKDLLRQYNEGVKVSVPPFEITARDILLPYFSQTLEGFDEDSPLFSGVSLEGTRQIKLEAFLSTPRFVKYLTDISTKLSAMKCSKDDKKQILIHDLRQLNGFLPAAVYLPFVSASARNYAVLHIPTSECRVF